MTENNNDKFWESNDDFWSKPVASDDWLKRDVQSAWQKEGTDQKLSDGTDTEPAKTVNPYLNQRPDSYAFETQEPQRTTVLNGQVLDKTKKKIHIHTIICLFFIALSIVSVVGAVVTYSALKESAINMANQVSYTETEVDNTFAYDEYNEVAFDGNAIVYISEENFTGFPKDQKLIGIYLEVYSEEYIPDANVLHDIYLGYEIEGRSYYQEIPRQDVIYPYVSSRGFAREEILQSYGLGNGINDSGYLFFFIPTEVEEVTLYMPKTAKEKYIDVIKTVYYLSFPVVDAQDDKEAG